MTLAAALDNSLLCQFISSQFKALHSQHKKIYNPCATGLTCKVTLSHVVIQLEQLESSCHDFIISLSLCSKYQSVTLSV